MELYILKELLIKDPIIMVKLTNKGRTLKNLQDKVKYGYIAKPFIFSIKSWKKDSKKIISKIETLFDSKIIIRSSAWSEDNYNTSLAGFFTTVKNVDVKDKYKIQTAIEDVIESYQKIEQDLDKQEILVQKEISNVEISGVVLSRDISSNSPYFVINYEKGSTDLITSGFTKKPTLIKIARNIQIDNLSGNIKKIMQMTLELEAITNCQLLDIEFAVFENNIYIFQVRKISSIKRYDIKLDKKVFEAIKTIEKKFKSFSKPQHGLYGNQAIFGNMPDWNPAEIIGTTPKPLAYSLYDYIFMKSSWRNGRGEIGYYNPPHSLMANFSGKPYIDVRADFNSLIPKSITSTTANKLINYYINKLINNPEFHDKVEFEIVESCFTLLTDNFLKSLEKNGFDENEIDFIEKELLTLTNFSIKQSSQLDQIFKDRFELLDKVNYDLIINSTVKTIYNQCQTIAYILEVCIQNGAIPFSYFVRKAFIGLDILKSFLDIKVINKNEYNLIFSSFKTVTSILKDDLDALYSKKITKDVFLEKYGHLRPGTYDITSLNYKENFNIYFLEILPEIPKELYDKLPPEINLKDIHGKINNHLKKTKLEFSSEDLIEFIENSLQMREASKLSFSKSIDATLNLIEILGNSCGINRDDMAFIKIQNLTDFVSCFEEKSGDTIKKNISNNKKEFLITSKIILPHLIVNAEDIKFIRLEELKPNYITNETVIGEPIHLSSKTTTLPSNIEECIVFIENADPGFDWIFTRRIKGLVTKYGGAGSHMTLRCAELKIPAAIGCGEVIFDKLSQKKKIMLNCEAEIIKGII
ncbi:PEP-utilizing enzyme [Larkinella punicea]|uniref:PEP-utilising enzyme mobile domain-containing protein n=1 Tax=Larkinella punicea TaxID=2315727 RepID=A0A368JM25_9BACT|nr:PEP-utilizing enzyme [Larkinella punicea]RCR68345.1 hypothetical protein DUE52_16425 [Larkinella punicea]